MPLRYLLRLHTLLFEGFVSSFHGFALCAAAAHLAFGRIFLKLSWLCTMCCRCTPCFLKDFSQALMPVHYLLLHTLLLQGFSQVSMALHYLLLLRTTLYKRSGT